MTVRALDPSGDIVTSGVQFLRGYSALEVAQNVRTRLRMYTNEWFLDLSDGTPWLEDGPYAGILGKGMTQAERETQIRRRILLTPGLSRMTSFKMDFDLATRRLTVTTGIISQSGEETLVTFQQAIF